MNKKQVKIIEIHGIVNIHEANPEDTYLLMPDPFNGILTSHLQVPGGGSVHFVSICLTMQLGHRLELIIAQVSYLTLNSC